MLWTIPHSFGITHLNGSSTREGLELVGWTLKVDAWDARENSRQGKQQQEEEVSSQRSSVKRGLAGPGSLQLGRPGSRPATCRLRASRASGLVHTCKAIMLQAALSAWVCSMEAQ